MLSRLRSYFLFVPLVFLYTGVFGLISLAASLFDGRGRMQHALARAWSWLILKTCRIQVRVSGVQGVDTSKPHLYAINHLSAFDIPVLYSHLPFQFRIIAKKELFRYPFMGWHMRRSGQIPVDASSAASSMRTLNLGVETLRHGMPLVVFPEGGRSPDGHVQDFLPGAFYTAIRARVEVIPVALVGTYDVLPMNTFHIQPRPVELLLGTPISTAGYHARDMEKLAALVRSAVEDLYYSRAEMPPKPDLH